MLSFSKEFDVRSVVCKIALRTGVRLFWRTLVIRLQRSVPWESLMKFIAYAAAAILFGTASLPALAANHAPHHAHHATHARHVHRAAAHHHHAAAHHHRTHKV